MTEEKKTGIADKFFKLVKKALEIFFIFVIAFIFSLWLGEKIDCQLTNQFIMQNIWDGGINCPVN